MWTCFTVRGHTCGVCLCEDNEKNKKEDKDMIENMERLVNYTAN